MYNEGIAYYNEHNSALVGYGPNHEDQETGYSQEMVEEFESLQ